MRKSPANSLGSSLRCLRKPVMFPHCSLGPESWSAVPVRGSRQPSLVREAPVHLVSAGDRPAPRAWEPLLSWEGPRAAAAGASLIISCLGTCCWITFTH